MRKFFISDIHGCFNEMMQLFTYAEFDPSVDELIVGGDMIDRGPDSASVLRYIYLLKQNYPDNVFVLRGNHEDMMKDYFETGADMWLSHGREAIESFNRDIPNPEEYDKLIEFAITLPTLIEDEQHIFVHAGINPLRHEQLDEELVWMPYDTRARRRFDSYTRQEVLNWSDGRKVVHGHTPKKYIFDDGARICCDLGAGTTDTAKLALVNLTDNTYFYYDFLTGTIHTRAIAGSKNAPVNANS